MKAIILAAGKATRLLPLTKDTHQCLLEVNGKPILEHQIKALNKAGIKDITVITGYFEDKVKSFCDKLKVKTLFNPFYTVSGMAMTLWIAKEELKNGFLFLYSDIIFDPLIVKGMLQDKSDILLAIKKDGLREEAEKVIEKNNIIKNVTKRKIKGENGEFIGIAKFSANGSKKLIQQLNEIGKKDLNARFIDAIDVLIKDSTIPAYNIKNKKFIDIDFPEDLKKSEKFV